MIVSMGGKGDDYFKMRIGGFIVSLIAVVSCAASIWFFIEKETARANYRELERTLGLENSFLKRTIAELSDERDKIKIRGEQLSEEIAQVKQEKLEITARLNTTIQIQQDLQGEINSLQKNIADIEGERETLSARIHDQQLRIAQLQSQVLSVSSGDFVDRKMVESLQKELQNAKEDRSLLEQKLASAGVSINQLQRPLPVPIPMPETAKSAIELPPIVVGTKPPVLNSSSPLLSQSISSSLPSPGMRVTAMDASIPDGKVLSVNQEHQFVVIGLGEKDGIKPGMRFKVLRGDEEVGSIEVIETRPSIAAADIKEIRTASLQAEDRVLLSQR